MSTRKQSASIRRLATALLAGSLVLLACSPAVSPSAPPNPTETSAPVATFAPTAGAAPSATAVLATEGSPAFSLDTGGLATGLQTETVAAVAASDAAPYWEVLPEYTRVTLQGYPISSHLLQPQIFIYPAAELGTINEGAGGIVASLQSLLQSPQEIANMPFLPLFNASQVMHAQVQYLDFRSGHGLRYVTEFAQAFLPINNYDLIYTYQGLTADGKYYVAAVLPVNHPSLPAEEKVTGSEPPEFTSDFPAYLANTTAGLNQQATNSFAPDLAQLDAMMSSLEIR